ncbi:MAG: glycosyltransferase family 39 protein [Candidatus Micrarchaeia archaeon]
MDNKTLALLALILLAALALRVYNLPNAGLREGDETVYALEAQCFTQGPQPDCPECADYLNWRTPEECLPFGSFKPLFIVLAGGLTALTGDALQSVLLLSALAGALTVLLAFLLGREWGNEKIGLLAAALLAVCGMHLQYSRTGLTEVTQTLFLVLAVYLYALAKRKGVDARLLLFAAGIAAGACFETRYVGAIALPILFLLEAMHDWGKAKALRKFVYNTAIIAAGFLVVFAAFVLLYSAFGMDYGFYFVSRMGNAGITKTLVENIPFLRDVPHVDYAAGGGLEAATATASFSQLSYSLFYYGYYFYRLNGPLIALLLVAGACFALVRRDKNDLRILAVLTALTAFYILAGFNHTRNLVALAPFLAIPAAALLLEARKNTKQIKKYSLGAFLAVVALASLAFVYPMLSFEWTAFQETGSALAALNATGVINNVPFQAYHPVPSKSIAGLNEETLAALPGEYTHLVITSEFIYNEPDYAEAFPSMALAYKIREKCPPTRIIAVTPEYWRGFNDPLLLAALPFVRLVNPAAADKIAYRTARPADDIRIYSRYECEAALTVG